MIYIIKVAWPLAVPRGISTRPLPG